MASTLTRRGASALVATLIGLWLPLAQASAAPAATSEQPVTAQADADVATATTPIVSPHDDRDYRVLTLDNGLDDYFKSKDAEKEEGEVEKAG